MEEVFLLAATFDERSLNCLFGLNTGFFKRWAFTQKYQLFDGDVDLYNAFDSVFWNNL